MIFHEQHSSGYGFPSLLLVTCASAGVSELFLSTSKHEWRISDTRFNQAIYNFYVALIWGLSVQCAVSGSFQTIVLVITYLFITMESWKIRQNVAGQFDLVSFLSRVTGKTFPWVYWSPFDEFLIVK